MYCDDPGELGEAQEVPLIPFEKQRELITAFFLSIMSTVGTSKRVIELLEKSREMGASWIICGIAVWFLLFKNSKIQIAAQKGEATDRKGNLNTPFEKCRYILRRLPPWMLPPGFDLDDNTGEQLITNPCGGQIVGEASVAHIARGGRALFGIFDEFSIWDNAEPAMQSTAQTCRVRFLIGTPNGPNNLFAHIARGKSELQANVRRLHWSAHPVKGAGLRKLPDGTVTAPFYEDQRAVMSPEQMAAELDIKYDTSTKALIFSDFTKDHIVKGLRPEPGRAITCILDPGLEFHLTWIQIDNYGRVLCLYEQHIERAQIHEVARLIGEVNNDRKIGFKDFEIEYCGDPAGGRRQNSGAEIPEYETLLEYDIDVDWMFMDEIATKLRVRSRIQAIHNKLREYVPQKKTLALLVDEDRCPWLVDALSEGYRWKIDKRTKKIIEPGIVDEVHPHEDAVDCLGMGLLYKIGVVGQRQSGKVVPIQKGSVTWPGRRRAGGR